jgi:hypothetical protein
MVERWFGQLTQKIRQSSFYSVPELIQAIHDYLEAHNENPKPFVWIASVGSTMEKINGCQA